MTSRAVQKGVHARWIDQLGANLPEGVPTDERPVRGGQGKPWPATFGDMVDGKPVHRLDEGEGYCFQCLSCQHYVGMEGLLGMDWGVCIKEGGQYDRQAVFEHWTCKDFLYGEMK